MQEPSDLLPKAREGDHQQPRPYWIVIVFLMVVSLVIAFTALLLWLALTMGGGSGRNGG